MLKTLLAAVAALALYAQPAAACGDDCKDCPHHKVAAAGEPAKGDKAGKADKAVACPCGDGKECKCPEKCECPHCHAKKAAAEKTETKKT